MTSVAFGAAIFAKVAEWTEQSHYKKDAKIQSFRGPIQIRLMIIHEGCGIDNFRMRIQVAIQNRRKGAELKSHRSWLDFGEVGS